MTELLKTFKVDPTVAKGTTNGHKVTWVKKGSVVDRAGLKIGDILVGQEQTPNSKSAGGNGVIELQQDTK